MTQIVPKDKGNIERLMLELSKAFDNLTSENQKLKRDLNETYGLIGTLRARLDEKSEVITVFEKKGGE